MGIVSERFIDNAQKGKNVYIHQIRAYFSQLQKNESVRFTLALVTAEDEKRRFDYTIPKFEVPETAVSSGAEIKAYPPKVLEAFFIRDYCMAELYNIISCLGARSMCFYGNEKTKELLFIYNSFLDAFGINTERSRRKGYGRAVNVAERILDALDNRVDSKISVSLSDNPESLVDFKQYTKIHENDFVGKKLQLAVQKSNKGILLGIDVGGTDIKLAVSVDGNLKVLKEHDWFPATFTRIHELIDPILALADLLRYRTDSRFDMITEKVMQPAVSTEAIIECTKQAKEYAKANKITVPFYDAIGLSFPDVVVKDSIVGGEVFKTRGIRENPSINYEEEFRLITHLNKELRQFVIQDGVIGIVNDGPMAAFTAAAETAYEDIDSVNKGVLAYTLGTELGTGYLNAQGKIPNIPLEVYNFIIDLGSWPEKIFPSDDVRSINNFNTELAGTLQKYTSQSGAFRLAVKYFPKENPTLYNSLFEKNFLTEHHSAAGDSEGLYLVVKPKDMRKPFLEYLMSLAAQGTETNAQRIFTEIGEYLAVAFAETKRILEPTADTAILFGRLVKQKKCFELLHSGSKDLVGENAFMPANEEMALTPLMKQLKDNKYYTVAQFAQAIGAIHYASYRKNILA